MAFVRFYLQQSATLLTFVEGKSKPGLLLYTFFEDYNAPEFFFH